MSKAYAKAGVSIDDSDRAVAALVNVLRTINPGRTLRSAIPSGHYASVLTVAPNLGIALATDGVGSKLVVAEQTGRFNTVGIDCIAMNVNDIICVGAEPLALLDYIAVETPNEAMLSEIGVGLKAGAEMAQIEIPGGEVAVLPELLRGHPSPYGFDLTGACFGTIALDKIVTGKACQPGDAIIGIPSSGVHSNGLTLARRALLTDGGFDLDDRPADLGGQSIADVLLEPTTIYVQAIQELLAGPVQVKGLAHLTGGGLTNLLRLDSPVGFLITQPLPVLPVFNLIAEAGAVSIAELYRVFNMGCGFCVIVPSNEVDQTVAVLKNHHPGTAQIGLVTNNANRIELPSLGLIGDSSGIRATS